MGYHLGDFRVLSGKNGREKKFKFFGFFSI